MTTPSSGIIKLSDIKNVFGGTGITKLSDYYSNSSKGYTTGISGIPLIGSFIKFSNFYNKSKVTINTGINITSIGNVPIPILVTGSTTDYYYRFLHQGASNTTTVENYTDYTLTFTKTIKASILVVGGGGGGGISLGSGGGAGGLVYIDNTILYTFNPGTYLFRIGAGGAGMPNAANDVGINGTSSIIFSNNSSGTALITALGGGRGNGQSNNYPNNIASRSGGSGAGGCRWANTGGAGIQTTSASISTLSKTYGFGNSGGPGTNGGTLAGGGGGGAGTSGVSLTGGDAKLINITGNNEYFAAGGGSTSNYSGIGNGGQGPPGTFLGGIGGYDVGGNGVINTGSGGGGSNGIGGIGSAGTIIIAFNNNQLPVTSGLFAMYTGEGPFTKTGSNITQWNDISGLNNHIITYRGTPTQISISKGLFGTVGTGTFNIVNGTINDGFKLPFALPQNNNANLSSYTIAYIARYTGAPGNTASNRRIFDSTATVGNHIWGFHGNCAGRSHNANFGWRTETFNKTSDQHYWMIGVETELLSRFNGIDWTIYNTRSDGFTLPKKSTTTPTFSINFGAYSGDGNTSETSNWQVAELIFYNRELTLNEIISLENYLGLKYDHFSFSNVVSSLNNYKLLTNNTGTYNGWYHIWNGLQYAYLNSTWIGPSKGQFVTVGNLGYFGILYANGNQNSTSGYANRNNLFITYNNIKTVANVSKIHIIACGGGGGGGASSIGGGGGAAGLCFISNATNLSDINLSFVVGNKGRFGGYFSTYFPGSGGDSSVSWTINSINYSMIGYGGYEGGSNRVAGAGGLFTVTNANSGGTTGGGNGGAGLYNVNLCPGGAIFTPTNQILNYTGISTNLWVVAQAFGASSYNSTYWWGGNSSGNGGSGAGFDGTYARDASEGGWGWVLIIYDNNV